jgi:Niemann-Pick C1 protein
LYDGKLTTIKNTNELARLDIQMSEYEADQQKSLLSKGYDFFVKPFTLEDIPANTPPSTNVFTYSLFYVFFDQYTYIRGVMTQNILLGIAAVFFAIQILSSLSIAIFISVAGFLVMLQLMGCMWILNEVLGGFVIEMNAVFVVNLVTSIGFGVEFCNHIGMNFMKQQGTREERAKKALSNMGSSVLVGIASTKFIGVIVLAFAPSTLF